MAASFIFAAFTRRNAAFALRTKRGAVLADIQSANIVGYTTIAAPAAGRYVALGVKFDSVGDQKFTINNMLVNSAPKGAPAFNSAADCIWLWDPTLGSGAGNWAKYFYSSMRKGFVKQGETVLATTELKNGDTLLFYRGTGAAAATLTLSGAVAPLEIAVPAFIQKQNLCSSAECF